MTTALEHVRYSCGIAGEEVAEMVDQLEAENARLREELAAAQAESKRYRWLTDGIDHEIDIASWDGEQWCCNYMDKVAIDAAIDEAIAKENGK